MSGNGPERMTRAATHLGQITEMIDRGQKGVPISFPIQEAALVLRIPVSTLEKLETRGQMLGVVAEKGNLLINLQGSPDQQVRSYQFLYGLLQSYQGSQADKFLASQEPPSSLLEEIPSLEETLAVIERGGFDLPEEEIIALHIQLYGRWRSLSRRTNLFPPDKVFA